MGNNFGQNENIEDIFKNNIEMLEYINDAIYFFRSQDYFKGNIRLKNVLDKLNRIFPWILENIGKITENIYYIDENYMVSLLKLIETAQYDEDYILLADILEKEMLILIEEIQKFIMSEGQVKIYDYMEKNLRVCRSQKIIEDIKQFEKTVCKNGNGRIENNNKISNEEIIIEQTNSGLLTACFEKNGRKKYLHSNVNPALEGKIFADRYITEKVFDYVIYGLGFAYHINAMLKKDKRIRVKVVESNMDMVCKAFHYMDLSELLQNERFCLIIVKEAENIRGELLDANEFIIHYPSIFLVSNEKIRNVLEDYFVKHSSIKSQKKKLDENFYLNCKEEYPYIDELESKFQGKTMLLIAAGPSLANNMEKLREIYEQKNPDNVIVSVGTVAEKLINSGIIPNYVVVTDANEIIYNQIKNIEALKNKVSLLFLSTSSNKAVKAFRGKRYMICQNGYEEAEKIAKQEKLKQFETGGSVATIAVDIGIRFDCRRIICIGLDLAFAGSKSHAFEKENENGNFENVRKVAGINGGQVITSRNLDIYRKWIENRIEGENIEILNASGGAFIKGMKKCSLDDLFKIK